MLFLIVITFYFSLQKPTWWHIWRIFLRLSNQSKKWQTKPSDYQHKSTTVADPWIRWLIPRHLNAVVTTKTLRCVCGHSAPSLFCSNDIDSDCLPCIFRAWVCITALSFHLPRPFPAEWDAQQRCWWHFQCWHPEISLPPIKHNILTYEIVNNCNIIWNVMLIWS